MGHDFMLYSTASTGVGGGLILGGKLYRGANGCAGEIGHMLATPGQGVTCGCGLVGDYESYCGGSHIHQHVKLRLARGESTVMTELAGSADAIDGKILARAYAMGDSMAQEIVAQTANYLGILYFNLYQALNLDCFVIGGGLTALGDPLMDGIRASFESLHALCPLKLPVHIKKAQLAQDEYGIIGAALLLCE